MPGSRAISRIWLGTLVAVCLGACTPEYTFRGALYRPARSAPAMAGVGTDSRPFQLSDHTGKVLLVFFGYTSSPDTSPATLGEMKRLYQELGADAKNVALVFVSVDPARDTLQRLKEYLAAFDDRFIGVRVEPENLADTLASYGAWAVTRYLDPGDSSAGYTVDHTTRLYAIDKAGRLRASYPFGTLLPDIRSDIGHLLRERAPLVQRK